MMIHIAGYRFTTLDDIDYLQPFLREWGERHALKGTILLSHEGININVSGTAQAINALKAVLNDDVRLANMCFHEYETSTTPYRRYKVKIKKEIITFRKQGLNPANSRAQAVSPETLKQWLDDKRDITLLDTRNEYEIDYGTFNQAVNLHLNHFTDLPEATRQLDPNKTVVMFCTGGIRCEKAALYLTEQGFSDVYQLDGGILGYFSKIGGDHYSGGCFVFDERVSVEPQ